MELQYALPPCLQEALVPFFWKTCNATEPRTHSLTVAIKAGESLLIVFTTVMLASYVVSDIEDSLADCRHDGLGITPNCNHNRDAGVICGKWYRGLTRLLSSWRLGDHLL